MPTQDKAAILASLPVRGDENPFAVTIGGFYRRWFNLVDDLQALIDLHRSRGAVATLNLTQVADPTPFGLVLTEADGKVRSFLEKLGYELHRAKTNIGLGRITNPDALQASQPEPAGASK